MNSSGETPQMARDPEGDLPRKPREPGLLPDHSTAHSISWPNLAGPKARNLGVKYSPTMEADKTKLFHPVSLHSWEGTADIYKMHLK